MTRKEAIGHIEALYPPDSQYEKTAASGKEFIESAKRELAPTDWREESDDVLILAATRMIQKEGGYV